MAYQLTWLVNVGEYPRELALDPDHPMHDENMAQMPRLERRILRAYLEEALTSLNRTGDT